MRNYILYLLSAVFIALSSDLFSQEKNESSIAATDAAENLDLSAVLALFQESKDLANFEKKLNEKDGVNNLDLNDDGEVDYLRVNELEGGYYRVIVIQAVLGENDVQDVAVINVERKSEKDIKVECEGNSDIYGADYYVAPPPTIQVYVWPIWRVMFAPHYVVYHSPWHYHRYPPYWYGRPPVPPHVYHQRHIVVTHRHVYVHRRTAHVHRPPNVYRPHRSKNAITRYPQNRNNVNRTGSVNKSNKPRTNNSTVNKNTRPNTGKVNSPQNNRKTTPNNNYNKNRTNPNKNSYNRSQSNKGNYNRSKPNSRPTTRYRTGGGGRRR